MLSSIGNSIPIIWFPLRESVARWMHMCTVGGLAVKAHSSWKQLADCRHSFVLDLETDLSEGDTDPLSSQRKSSFHFLWYMLD